MDPEELQAGREGHSVGIKVSGATPDATTPTLEVEDTQQPRRRSIYNFPFFLRHQDAVDAHDDTASPPATKKGMKNSGKTVCMKVTVV